MCEKYILAFFLYFLLQPPDLKNGSLSDHGIICIHITYLCMHTYNPQANVHVHIWACIETH